MHWHGVVRNADKRIHLASYRFNQKYIAFDWIYNKMARNEICVDVKVWDDLVVKLYNDGLEIRIFECASAHCDRVVV